MGSLDASLDRQKDAGLLIIRLVAAVVFVFHGSQILFGAWGGPGPAGFAGMLHMSIGAAYAVGLAQFCGGIALGLGLLTRLGALCILIVMAGAIYLVHWSHGFSVVHNGIEYPLTQACIALALLVAGAGRYALGAGLGRGARQNAAPAPGSISGVPTV